MGLDSRHRLLPSTSEFRPSTVAKYTLYYYILSADKSWSILKELAVNCNRILSVSIQPSKMSFDIFTTSLISIQILWFRHQSKISRKAVNFKGITFHKNQSCRRNIIAQNQRPSPPNTLTSPTDPPRACALLANFWNTHTSLKHIKVYYMCAWIHSRYFYDVNADRRNQTSDNQSKYSRTPL